jgi:plastocyanin
MSRLFLALAVALSALVLTASVSAMSTATPTLSGVVGPAFNISLKKGTKKVTTLKAGKYKLVVSDRAATHNFHIVGPGLDKKTGVASTGTTTWTVTLKKGTYRYVCDPHKTFMKGSFTVT